jgi:tetratricopeptide (TPR) repeat protein
LGFAALCVSLWGVVACHAVWAQDSAAAVESASIAGVVRDSLGEPVGTASVRLHPENSTAFTVVKTDLQGGFIFSRVRAGSYSISAEKAGVRSQTATVVAASGVTSKIDLRLGRSDGASGNGAMDFADQPDFTVAGVTDWTAVGGHGSDATLRTSEALARDTLTLKSAGGADSAGASDSDKHRQAGEADEKSGDPLAAVHEFEEAVRLDPSERNYFEWGTELLLHRAVWQAETVFRKGAEAYPKSARMLTAWGTALFAGARYDEAAQRLCEASDLTPADPEPYIFLGKIEIAAPKPLACVEAKLVRFVAMAPNNSVANYFYAMAVLKRQEGPQDKDAIAKAEELLTKAVTDDPKCSDGYLQLGILAYSERDVPKAIRSYIKAIEANPQSGEAHYRLGVAYDRLGNKEKAQEQFRMHDAIEKQKAAVVEQQRREVKQFLVVLQGQSSPQTN